MFGRRGTGGPQVEEVRRMLKAAGGAAKTETAAVADWGLDWQSHEKN